MLFFSAILGAVVRDIEEVVGGKTVDVLIKTTKEDTDNFPPLLGIVMRDKKTKKDIFIPMKAIETWGPKEIELDQKFSECVEGIPTGENIVSLRNSVLDKQIVDLEGMRVVRVNDLQFGRVKQVMSLIAIDISTRGLLRRLGFYSSVFDRIFKTNFLEWNSIELTDNKLHLSKGVADIVKLHPADIANIIEKMNLHQGSTLLESLDHATAARVFEEIEPEIQKVLIRFLGAEKTANLMNKMSVDELVDLIQLMPDKQSREIMRKLPGGEKKEKVRRFLEYDEDTAGGLMTTEFITATPNDTVQDVIEHIRKFSHMHHSILFIYVVDKNSRFLGVVSTRSLIIADKTEKIKEVMRKEKRIHVVKEDDDIDIVATAMTKYNLLSVAVVDKKKKLLGVVTVDDIMRSFIPKA